MSVNAKKLTDRYAVSMREERVRTEIIVVPADKPNIIIEIGAAKIRKITVNG